MRLLALLACLLFAGCPDPIDNGFVLVENGQALYVDWIPQLITYDETVEDTTIVEESIVWWNNTLSRDGTERVWFDDATDPADYDISICEGDTIVMGTDAMGVDIWADGIAAVSYDETGLITNCAITLLYDNAYHRPTMLEALKHELGHCLGLADDPHSTELNSIMNTSILYTGELTQADWNRLIGMME